jgi:hypothetical protein
MFGDFCGCPTGQKLAIAAAEEVAAGGWPDMTSPPSVGELDQLGFSTTRTCPRCGEHLYWSVTRSERHMICLNACHLGAERAERFRQTMANVMKLHKGVSDGSDSGL